MEDFVVHYLLRNYAVAQFMLLHDAHCCTICTVAQSALLHNLYCCTIHAAQYLLRHNIRCTMMASNDGSQAAMSIALINGALTNSSIASALSYRNSCKAPSRISAITDAICDCAVEDHHTINFLELLKDRTI